MIITTTIKENENITQKIKETIKESLNKNLGIISINKRGKMFYGVLKDKTTKEIFGIKYVVSYVYDPFNYEYKVEIKAQPEGFIADRLFTLKEMIHFTEDNDYSTVRIRSLSNINKRLKEEQINVYNHRSFNKGKRIKSGSILKFDKVLKFNSGFEYDTFKFVNKDNFVLPDESLDTERKYVIYKFRQRDFTIIKEG